MGGGTFGRVLSAGALLAVSVSSSVGAGPSGGALPPQLIEIVVVTGDNGVPDDVEMVALNVTAVSPAGPGFLTVFSCDDAPPATSNVNYLTDQVVPNLVLSKVAADGTICIATHAVTDVLVDLVGYVPAGSAVHPLAVPARVVDTRDRPGGAPSPRPAGSVLEIPISGRHGVDADAEVVMFNATAIAGDQPGFLTAYPCGTDIPATSSVNHLAHQIVPNMVTSRVGDNGSICVFTLADADIVIDVAAYATDGITPLPQPVRLSDTRQSNRRLTAGGTLTLDITSRPDVPDDATAAAYNLTAVNPAGAGFVTSYPCDGARPDVSNLNYRPGQIVANGAITKLSATGQLCLYSLAATDLIVDLIAFTRGASQYQPLDPTRLLDTRQGWQSRCDWVITGFTINTRVAHLANVRTGQTVSLANPTPPTFGGSRPIVAASCTHIWWQLTAGVPEHLQGVYRINFDGSSSLAFPRHQGVPVAAQMFELEGGRLIGVYGTAVFDLVTGDQAWTLPEAQVFGNFGSQTIALDVSQNGVVARLSGTVGVVGGLEVIDLFTGELLTTVEFDERVPYRAALAPDGRYIAVALMGDASGVHDSLVVLTPFGDAVDGFRDVPQLTPTFLGTGQLALCLHGRGLFVWDLYGPVADPGLPCT